MGKKSRAMLLVLAAGFYLFFSPLPLPSQTGGGDQFLDGIGETALVARYLLDGNSEDRSRNHFHALLQGEDAGYADDEMFGRVLRLPGGEKDSWLEIPGRALSGADSLSVMGWILLRSEAPGRFFDFGQDAARSFFCGLGGADAAAGFQARLVASGADQGFQAAAIPAGRWVHLALVLDAANGTLTGYANGRRTGQVEGLKVSIDKILDQKKMEANHLYIGRAQAPEIPGVDALLRDLRLYDVALDDRQIETVFRNAMGGARRAAAAREDAAAEALVASTPLRSLALGLEEVPDIVAETTVGTLPRLPVFVPGAYRDGEAGPLVRVIWPSPTDNSEVREPGTYTLTGTVPGTGFQPKAVVNVKPAPATAAEKPQRRLETFPLGDVTLNRDAAGRETPFIKNRDKFIRGLAKTNPDSFLYNFRDAFGQQQPAGVVPLGGWDDQTTRLRGHASGHYLSAIAQACAGAAGDAELHAAFLAKMNTMIDTLYDLSRKSGRPAETGGPCNADPVAVPPGPGKSGFDSDLSKEGIRTDYWNWGTGYISAYPPDQFIMLEKGATYGGTNAQIWAPYYTLHKILAGLLDCYEVGGNRKALEIAAGMGNWVYQRLTALPEATRISMWSRYIAGEYGGMNEVMARLYRLSRKPEFLACAKLFANTNFFFGDAEHRHGLAKNVDTLSGRHANQHIPQIVGALETYRDGGETPYYDVAHHFWTINHDHYTYSIGGVAGARKPNNAECYPARPDTLFANGFARGGQNETCATYNLLKLSRQLFLFDSDTKYMDYYEQALYNHILASVAEEDAGNTYHVPLNPGARKRFGNAEMNGFSCCNGTALESNTKLQDSIYFRSADNQALYVNLYIPSTVTWKERNVVLTQKTSFPYADSTELVVSGSGAFALHVRVPGWATKGFIVAINGREQKVKAVPGTYLTLKRAWKDGDTVSLRMPFSFRLDSVMDHPNIASLFYGPVLLAVEESGPQAAWRPITLDRGDISRSIQGDPATLRFTCGELSLKPFFETYGNHSVYLDVTLQ
ncbi:MAG: beta-L-arabinofuranosidase domain-containing protein [Candidatus Aminicenantales bacterium]